MSKQFHFTPAQGNLAEALRILLEEARANPQSAEECAEDLATLDAFEAQMKVEELAHEEAEQLEVWGDVFDNSQETVYLLNLPANETHLMHSIEQYRQGNVTVRDLLGE